MVKTNREKILIFRFSALGDVAMAIPVVASLAEAYPQYEFTFVSNLRFADLFRRVSNVRFIGIDFRNYTGIRGMYSLYHYLQSLGPWQRVFDLHDVLRTRMITFFFSFKLTRVHVFQKGRKDKKALTRQHRKILQPLESGFERYRRVFIEKGFSFDLTFESLFPEGEIPLTNSIRILTKGGKEPGYQWIGIAPFAQHKGKIYPEEKMKEVIFALSQRTNRRIFLFGGGSKEKELLDNWAETADNILSMAGKLPMHTELLLINRLDVMISMDSANMHLASLTSTPVVSIWGATHPYAGFYGYRQKKENIVQIDLPCRPCSIYGNRPCYRKDWACLSGIAPETIVEKTEKVLSGTKIRP